MVETFIHGGTVRILMVLWPRFIVLTSFINAAALVAEAIKDGD
jgi:hypothetical protein